MTLPPWRELPWPHLVRQGLMTVGAITLASFVEGITISVMTWVGDSECVGLICGLIAYVAVFHGLMTTARKPWD